MKNNVSFVFSQMVNIFRFVRTEMFLKQYILCLTLTIAFIAS